MKDRTGGVLYVGKAKDLRRRVSSYFQASRARLISQPKIRSMIPLIHDVAVIEVRSETEALLLEGKLIKDYRPRYNTDFTDDKRFLLIRVDVRSPLPRFRLCRNRLPDGSLYFGPFAHSGPLRRTLSEVRKKFGVLLADANPQTLADGRIRLYNDARRDIHEHANEITPEEYAERVRRACRFLEGRSREWLREMEQEMRASAERRDFESAATLRDSLFALRKTLAQARRFERIVPRPQTDGCAASELAEALNLDKPPKLIECFDISHISGSFTVASMVRFKDGKADRKSYRRFKIQSFEGNDDFRAMEEVVGRRYRRLAEEGSGWPDLIVIDGGKGQVTAAQRAFLLLDLTPPPLIGLAKKRETIIFADARPPLQLPLNHSGLQLLQQLRDEAHRFANRFNADLRSRKIKESVLAEIPGLGARKRESLLATFNTITRLRQATVEELTSAPGIGPGLASRIHAFLHPLKPE